MKQRDRQRLEEELGTLLESVEDVSEFLEPLLSIDSNQDLIDYLTQLLGRNGNDEEVRRFAANVERYRSGEDVIPIGGTTTQPDVMSTAQNAGTTTQLVTKKKKKQKPEEAASVSKRGGGGSTRKSANGATGKKAASGSHVGRKGGPATNAKNSKGADKGRGSPQPPQQHPQEGTRKEEVGKKAKEEVGGKTREDGAKQVASLQNAPPLKEKGATEHAAAGCKLAPPQVDPPPKKGPPRRGKAKVICGCWGTKHKALTNCLHCGRILCEKEGYGFCPFCGIEMEPPAALPVGENGKIDSAVLHKERLLRFDREFAERTQVFDDQADYYRKSESVWLTADEQAQAAHMEEERRRTVHERKKPVLELKFG